MTRWSSADLAAATGGLARRPFSANGVSIDSRSVRPGEVFVALATDTGDGHAHVAAALARGASGAMVHALPTEVSDDAPLLVVRDTLDGLWGLGWFARARFAGRVVAVTGSVGKTTTKEMLRRALAPFGSVWAAAASHNNHWGVPLTLARCPPGHAFCIVEIGTNHPGEILPLSRLARPDVAAVIAVTDAHLGNFPDHAALQAEKYSIADGVAVAVLPDGDGFAFGDHRAAIESYEGTPEGGVAHVRFDDVRAILSLAAPGRHMAHNALATLAIVAALDLDLARAAAALDGFSPVSGRGERRRVAWDGGDLLLIDESYNASPSAMRAALSVLAVQPGRKIAVLGDMLELGEHGPALHAGLAPDVTAADAVLFACGPLMRGLFDAVPAAAQGAHAQTSVALAPLVTARLRAGDAVLVKGSLGSRMRAVVDAIERVDAV